MDIYFSCCVSYLLGFYVGRIYINNEETDEIDIIIFITLFFLYKDYLKQQCNKLFVMITYYVHYNRNNIT